MVKKETLHKAERRRKTRTWSHNQLLGMIRKEIVRRGMGSTYWRKGDGWKAVATRLGVTDATYMTTLISGSRPARLEHAVALARLFGWDPRWVAAQLSEARRSYLESEIERLDEDLGDREFMQFLWENDPVMEDLDKNTNLEWPSLWSEGEPTDPQADPTSLVSWPKPGDVVGFGTVKHPMKVLRIVSSEKALMAHSDAEVAAKVPEQEQYISALHREIVWPKRETLTPEFQVFYDRMHRPSEPPRAPRANFEEAPPF